ncbi:MAG: AraC family transcriptional regulator [Polyangiaceae bacterium]
MRRAPALESYVADPFGAFYAGPGVLHFFVRPDLAGTLFWGCPDKVAVDELTRAIETELPERSPLHDAYVDTRRLTGIDPAAFEVLASYLGPRAVAFASNVRRQAIVRPEGVIGALVAGFYDVTPSATPEKTAVVTTPAAAMEWLRREDSTGLLTEIDDAELHASAGAPVVRALRAHLAREPRTPRLDRVAAALGLGPSELRRELDGVGTTLRAEVNAARMTAARALLTTSERKLSVIALELGFRSLSHFSSAFKKAVGVSPTEWRVRHRR